MTENSTDPDRIESILREAKVLVLDTETDGTDWKRNKSVGYVLTHGPAPEDTVYLPFRHDGGNLPWDVRKMFKRVLAPRHDVRLIFFAASFDLGFFAADDVHFNGILEDAQINAYLIDERQSSFSLDACCRFMNVTEKKGEALYQHMATKFGGEPTRRAQMKNYHRLAGNDPIGVDYAVGDGASTWALWEKQQGELDAQELRPIWEIECRCIRTLHRMVRRGIKVDEERLAAVSALVDRKLIEARSKLPSWFEDLKPTHLKRLFSEAGISDWPMTPKGNASFTKGWMKGNPTGALVVAAREFAHLKNSFFTPLLEQHLFNGRVHCTYNQTRNEEFGTITGRLSCSDPNMQQVHKRNVLLGSLFRSIFVPDAGMIWSSNDYNQCEPRLLAHYAKVELLLDGYMSDPPIDAHTAVARGAFANGGEPTKDQRQSGKTLNQALITGAGERKAALMLGKPPAEAMKIVNDYFAAMPEIKPFQRRVSQVFQARGYLRSLLGRRSRLDDPRFAYKGVNRLLQCGNADILKKAMCDVDEYYASEGDRVHLLANIHDDLADQFMPEDRHVHEQGVRLMEDFGPVGKSVNVAVPMTVDSGTGKNWAEATYGVETVRGSWASMGADYE